jgi:hypothetical protein
MISLIKVKFHRKKRVAKKLKEAGLDKKSLESKIKFVMMAI